MSKNSANVFFLGFFLCGVCAIAAAIMGSAAVLTHEPIEHAKAKKTADALHQVLPPFNNDPMREMHDIDGCRFYTARQDGRICGYAVHVEISSGYNGRISALISFFPDGKIRTVVVTRHSETPGLGAEVCDRTEVKTLRSLFSRSRKDDGSIFPNPVLDQYSGHSAQKGDPWPQPWKLTKDGGRSQYMTGATISSRAVNDLAWKAAAVFAAHKNELAEGEKK